MPSSSDLLPATARQETGKSMLFPVIPAPGETLPGYLLRNVEPNFLPGIRPIFKSVGLNVTLAGNCIDKVGKVADQLFDRFAAPPDAWARLWGVEGPQGGRRRLGGVWLTPGQIESGIRRVPPRHAAGDPDQAIWMVKDLGFCPVTWELLIDRCPRRGCHHLTWMSATALHICGHCRTPVSDAKRQTVPRPDRRALTWVLGLFGDEAAQERSMMALPPIYAARCPTDVYDLILAIARPLRVMRDPTILGRVNLEVRDVAAAGQFLLDFHRAHWDLHQHGAGVVSAFRKRLETLLRFSLRPAVRADVIKILQYGRPDRGNITPGWEAKWLSTTQAAGLLRVERRDVRLLASSGLLPNEVTIGGEHRTHGSFQKAHVDRMRDELRAQMSLREFQSRTGLQRSAVEQLLGLGLIAETTSAAAKLVYDGLHITRESAETLLRQVADAAMSDASDEDVPLREVMQGVGGRPKPWARLLRAAVNGELPGGLRCGRLDNRIIDLRVHPVTARHILMGGSEAGRPFAFQAGDLAEWGREEMTPSEVEEHLNCTAQDVSWLRYRKYLTPIVAKGAAQYGRPEVEALGRQLITTREIAARLGKSPAQLWPELQAFSAGGSLGQGFYDRALMESWMAAGQ